MRPGFHTGAAEPSVFGLVYHAHTAAAELPEDAVMGDGLADQDLVFPLQELDDDRG